MDPRENRARMEVLEWSEKSSINIFLLHDRKSKTCRAVSSASVHGISRPRIIRITRRCSRSSCTRFYNYNAYHVWVCVYRSVSHRREKKCLRPAKNARSDARSVRNDRKTRRNDSNLNLILFDVNFESTFVIGINVFFFPFGAHENQRVPRRTP